MRDDLVLIQHYVNKIPECEIREYYYQFVSDKMIYENRTISTIRWFTGTLSLYLKYLMAHGKDLRLESINSLTISGFLKNQALYQNIAKNTMLSNYKAINSFTDWLLKHKNISADPFEGIPKPKPEVKLPDYLNLTEAKQLLSYLKDLKWMYPLESIRNYCMFATFLFTGVRLNELLSLTLDDIDLENQTLRVVLGKMQKSRLIPIADQLRPIIADYLVARASWSRNISNSPYLFISAKDGSRITQSAIYKMLLRINSESGIKKHIYPHLMRHTCATLVLNGSSDLRAVQAMLGHTTLAMTLRYTQVSVEHLKNQMNKNPLVI
jgi:site-specific recombinase XerD